MPAATVVVAESGIRTAADVVAMGAAGAHAVLVGEALMRQPSPGRALAELRGQAGAAAPAPRVAIKVCGVTVPDDAAMVAAAGVDYVGLNCWPASRRHVVPDRLALLAGAARAARPEIAVVGLFVDAYVDEIAALHAAARFDVVQLHGDESVETCQAVRRRLGLPVWKAVAIAGADDVAGLRRWLEPGDAVDAILLDAPSAGRGGSGTRIDPALATAAVRAYPSARLVLAGGLDPDNVGAAIAEIRPWAVDVASGVELGPRLKDPERVRAFVAAVRAAEREAWPPAAVPVSLDP
ncbi:MAG: bifunctional indole-3-glycerol phosphate synthase/phosphoribosylanthranilate isomerase [Kofleriaceae bacterium]